MAEKTIKIGIDATRTRSGGGVAHLVGILTEMRPSEAHVSEVHVWTFESMAKRLPQQPWLTVHVPTSSSKSLLHQIFWQRYRLQGEATALGIDVMLCTDSGSVTHFRPSVVMSRDMLPFEPRELSRYELGKDWLRIWLLRHIHSNAFKRATGVLFLTNYAEKVITGFTGTLNQKRVVPHGVGKEFLENKLKHSYPENGERPVNLIYVSNVARYKHQWRVALAVHQLIEKGYRLNLALVGGGRGPAQEKLDEVLMQVDPKGENIKQYPFLPHKEIIEHIAQADIFVFASSCENMPNTLVEGMACGIPIACSNLGPMPEVLADGGIYFNPDSTESIADSIEQLLTDKNKRDFSRGRSKELAQQYSWKRCAEETLQYLLQVKTDYHQ